MGNCKPSSTSRINGKKFYSVRLSDRGRESSFSMITEARLPKDSFGILILSFACQRRQSFLHRESLGRERNKKATLYTKDTHKASRYLIYRILEMKWKWKLFSFRTPMKLRRIQLFCHAPIGHTSNNENTHSLIECFKANTSLGIIPCKLHSLMLPPLSDFSVERE